MSELLNEEVEAAIDEMVEESIIDTYYRMGYILHEEDLTSKKARRAASKAAVYMDTDNEENVKREMAKEHIRTGKDPDRAKAQVKAIENDKSGNAPASAKRAVAAKKKLKGMVRTKPAKPRQLIKKNNLDPQKFAKFKALSKAATGNPLDKANRTVQRVIDRETRASNVGFGPNKGESTADNIERGRAKRRKVKKETPKGGQ